MNWKLVHNGSSVLAFFQAPTDAQIGTKFILFQGTRTQCLAEIARLSLSISDLIAAESNADADQVEKTGAQSVVALLGAGTIADRVTRLETIARYAIRKVQ